MFACLNLSSLDRHFESMPVGGSPEMQAMLQPIRDFRTVLQRTERQVTFFGVFKAGKSTLLNAIIGTKLLPSRANRATGVITRLSYGTQPAASVVRRTEDGLLITETIHFGDIAHYILLDLSTTTAKAVDGIEEVNIQIPCPLLHHRCTLVDTPGLMDNPVLTERTFRELERSDLAVMVLSADKLLSQTEREAARQVNDLLKGNIVFVVNRLGLVDKEAREDVLAWARVALKGLGNPLLGEPRIFATEAKAALNAKRNGGTPQVAQDDGLLGVEAWLKGLFSSTKGEKVAMLSRLGVLECHLTKAQGWLQIELAEAEVAANKLRQAQAEACAQEQAEWKKRVTEARFQLMQVKDELDELGEGFVNDCISNVENLMNTDPEWLESGKLEGCLQASLDAYTQKVSQRVQEAVLPTGIVIPDFDLNSVDVNMECPGAENSATTGFWIGLVVGGAFTGGVGAAIGGAAGAWVGSLFGEDIRAKVLDSVEGKALELVPELKNRSDLFVEGIEKILSSVKGNTETEKESDFHLIADVFAKEQTDKLICWHNGFLSAVTSFL
jgi:outer membrane lipoprotein SlyB